MTRGPETEVWQVDVRSARGASHERTGTPNQDSGKAISASNASGFVLAVADGHGSPEHARSDRGSRFAVDVATEILSDFVCRLDGRDEQEMQTAASGLPHRIVGEWRKLVLEDFRMDPPAGSEEADNGGQDWPELLYGSTLVAAALINDLALYLQIGDGDITLVDRDGKATRMLPQRDDIPTNLTESLCQTDAKDRFRIEVHFAPTTAVPALVMLSTDGYRNSFANERAFLKVGQDLYEYAQKNGFEWLTPQLEGWLSETTNTGSGDDITVALAWLGSPGAKTKARKPTRRKVAAALIPLLLASVGYGVWSTVGGEFKLGVVDLWRTVWEYLYRLVSVS